MSREQLEKNINVELELFKTFSGFASALIAGIIALFLIKRVDRPDYFAAIVVLGLLFASFFAVMALVVWFKLSAYRNQYNSINVN